MRAATARMPIGSTGVELPALGVGTAGFGNVFGPMDEDVAARIVGDALDAGLSYFDTAPLYGNGMAEKRLGDALHQLGDPAVTISTKIGRVLDAAAPEGRRFDFSRDGIRRSFEESLVRLGRDRVDILFLHDPDEHEQDIYDTAWAAAEELRDEGLVAALGFGMNQWRLPLRFIRRLKVDVVMLAGRRTLLDQSALAEFMPAAAAAGVAVVTAGVFNSGILADPHDGAWYDYQPASAELLGRARRIKLVCERHGFALSEAALQFCLLDRRSLSTVVGVSSPALLQTNLQASRRPVRNELWLDLVNEGLLPNDTLSALSGATV
jgi:D-threo-aldose 1-dehydrogenase